MSILQNYQKHAELLGGYAPALERYLKINPDTDYATVMYNRKDFERFKQWAKTTTRKEEI